MTSSGVIDGINTVISEYESSMIHIIPRSRERRNDALWNETATRVEIPPRFTETAT
jgi:hypothetical protein